MRLERKVLAVFGPAGLALVLLAGLLVWEDVFERFPPLKYRFINAEGRDVPPPFPEWWREFAAGVWAHKSETCRAWYTRNEGAKQEQEISWLASMHLINGKLDDPLFPQSVAPANGRAFRCGYFDHAGNLALSVPFATAGRFSNHRAVVGRMSKDGLRYGFIDEKGDLAVAPEYTLAWPFAEGFAVVAVEAGNWSGPSGALRWGHIDVHGEPLMGIEYEQAGSFVNGSAIIQGGSLDGAVLIDHAGQVLDRLPTNTLVWPEGAQEGLAAVQDFRVEFRDSPFGHIDADIGQRYIDLKGRVVIPGPFELTKPFSEGKAAVKLNGKWGYINRDGEIVIEPQYDSAGRFHNGHAVVGDEVPLLKRSWLRWRWRWFFRKW